MITTDDVSKRLNSLGYAVSSDDTFALTFLILKVENSIKNKCNIKIVPECLKQVAIDMMCGEFLQGKKATGQLTEAQMEAVVKRINDGDTNVEFSTTTDANVIFDTFVKNLTNGDEDAFIRHRRLVW